MSDALRTERIRMLADLHMVLNDGKATKTELQWALRKALAFAEQANSKLRLAEPFIDAIIEVAEDVVRERTGA